MSPAEKSGVVGFKPTRGLIPTDGIIYSSQQLDTLGLLTRTVQDAEYMLHEFRNWADSPTRPEQIRLHSLSISHGRCFEVTFSGVRIGIPYNFLDQTKNISGHRLATFSMVVQLLEEAGAEIVWDVEIEGAETYRALPDDAKNITLHNHLKTATNAYLAGLKENPNNLKDLQDIIDFTKQCEAEEYPKRNVAVLEAAQATDPGSHEYEVMQKKEAYFADKGGISGTLDRYKLDVLMMPAMSVTMQAFASKAGSPVISLPIGRYLPITDVEKDSKNGLVTVAPNIPYADLLPCFSHILLTSLIDSRLISMVGHIETWTF